VKIRSIRPSISNTGIEIQMDGLARSPEALYEFEERLAQSAYFASVYPVSENTRESKTELNFDLAMSYIPAGKPEAVRQAADAKAGTPAASEREHAGEAPVVYAPAEGYTQADGQAEAAGTEGLPAGPSAAASRPESTKPASQRPPAAVLGDAGTVPPSPGQVPLGPGPDAGRAAASRPGEPTANIVPPAQPPGEIARATGKAAPLMTNKEMYEALGRELFLKRRGRMIPKTTTQHPDLTNEQFIEKLGESLFMKVRGGLKRDDHRPVYQPASEPESPEGS